MIAMLLALQASTTAPPPSAATPAPMLGVIERQELPATGCAVFLWSSAGDRTLVAMATATPARIRLSPFGGPVTDLARVGGEGPASFGFAQSATYKAGAVTVTLSLTIATRADLTAGAAVPQGALMLEAPGRDAVVVPVAGLIGCRT